MPSCCLRRIEDIGTWWSKENVKSNFFLTGPKLSKSAITLWFLGSLYRAVLVFWCFKSVKCWNFAFRSFSNIEQLPHHTRPKHSYTPLDASKPHKHTYIHTLHCSALRCYAPVISGQFRTTTDTNRNQKGCLRICGRSGWHRMMVADFFWCLMAFVSVSCCMEMWGGYLRSFSKGIWVLFPVVDS